VLKARCRPRNSNPDHSWRVLIPTCANGFTGRWQKTHVTFFSGAGCGSTDTYRIRVGRKLLAQANCRKQGKRTWFAEAAGTTTVPGVDGVLTVSAYCEPS
jgi:hypothetical protein